MFRPANTHPGNCTCDPAFACTSKPARRSSPRSTAANSIRTKTAALIYGEDLHNIAIEGRGTLDGQATYEWRPNNFTDFYILPNQRLMEATGKPLLRSFPAGHPKETVYPRLVLLLRCEDVRIAGLKFLRSRSWTINPYACKRLMIDGVYIYSSQKEAVWADGIDPDGCQDVRISNSTIETGDDALVFYSADIWGPALPTENVTVTNCRLSSASSAIKFCDGNSNAIRRVAINNVVITNSNRGIAFMVFDGGVVEDVMISDVADRDPALRLVLVGRWRSDSLQHQAAQRSGWNQARQRAGGRRSIRNVSIRNVIAHGTGTSAINGHPDSWLDGIHLENVQLFVSHDPNAPYENTRDALTLRDARNFTMKDVRDPLGKAGSRDVATGLAVENVQDLLAGRRGYCEARRVRARRF